jgi:hypothetical protein
MVNKITSDSLVTMLTLGYESYKCSYGYLCKHGYNGYQCLMIATFMQTYHKFYIHGTVHREISRWYI